MFTQVDRGVGEMTSGMIPPGAVWKRAKTSVVDVEGEPMEEHQDSSADCHNIAFSALVYHFGSAICVLLMEFLGTD